MSRQLKKIINMAQVASLRRLVTLVAALAVSAAMAAAPEVGASAAPVRASGGAQAGSTHANSTAPQPPQIALVQTYTKGVYVYFRIYYNDPAHDAQGFGFVGANGATWAEEEHPFSSPSYGIVGPDRIDYPFNLACGTAQQYDSYVQAWIYDTAGAQTNPVTIYLACTAPPTPVTPPTTSPPSPPTFVCLGGSVCTGGTTTIGTGSKKVTVPKVPTKISTQKLTETQILDLVDLFRQVLIAVKTLFHFYGETLPFYVANALLCPTSPASAELRCFQNSGFPQAPLKG